MIVLDIVDGTLPCTAFIDLAGGDRLIHQLGSLGINLPAAKRIMPHFRIPHICIGGQADRRSVRLDRGMRPPGHQLVQLRFIRMHHGIPMVLVRPANAVHYN